MLFDFSDKNTVGKHAGSYYIVLRAEIDKRE
jgi:hypothetical protein